MRTTGFDRRLASSWIVAAALVSAMAPAARSELLGITAGPAATLYDIDTGTGAPSNPRLVGNKVNMIAVSPAGTLYGVSQGFPSDVPPGGGLFTINVTTGAATFVATLDKFVVTEGDIAFDPTSGILYAIDSEGDLFTINTTTGVCTLVGDVSSSNIDLSAMAFDAAGNLYMVDSFGPNLLQVNKSTAAVINSQSITPAVNQEIGGLAFRPGDGKLFFAGGTTSRLYTIQTGSAASTLVGPITAADGIWGLAFRADAVSTESASWGRIKSLWR